MKLKKLLFMLSIIFSISMVVPTMDMNAETVNYYHYDENLGVYVIDSSCVLASVILYGDVYISEDAVLSIYNTSIYGTVYVYGGMKFDSSSYVTKLVANSMSWSSSDSYSPGEVKASGTLISGTNYRTMEISIKSLKSLPIYIKDNLILSVSGKLKMSGSYANALPMSLEGYGKIEVDSKGFFNISDIEIGDTDTITLSWAWNGNPSNKITKELRVVKCTIDSNGNINYPPLINANDICLNIGEEYDFMTDVSAIDSEDGDISRNIIVDTNNLDINKRGTYTIKYYVEDSIGQKTEKDVQVTIIDPKVLSVSFSDELVTKDCTTSSFVLIPNIIVQDNPKYKLLWKSDNEDIIKVDSNGHVTVLGVGSATITVQIDENNIATCKVNIEHDWADKYTTIIEPTCIRDGSEEILCSKCGIAQEGSRRNISARHIWNTDFTIDKAPTCTEKGSKSIHCSVCDFIRDGSSISIPMKNHITELRNEKEATYVSTGYTGDKICTVCGEIIQPGTVIPVKERVEATGKFALLKIFLQKKGLTDSDGNKYFQYLDNEQKNIINTGTITYLEDNAQFELHFLSASDKGISTIKMLIEENGSQEVTVEYSFDTVSLNANATFDVKNYTIDGNVYFEKTSYNILDNSQIQNLCNSELHVAFCCWDLLLLDNLGLDVNMADLGFTSYEEAGTHTWADNYTYVSTEPTCTESGIMTYICKICKETRTEEIPAIGHRWDNGIITTNPTALKEGVRTYTCTVCGETKQEEIPASGVPKKGSIISDHHSSYRVTRSGTKNATVEFLGTKSSKTSITIPNTIVVDGIKYKVASVASNAFKNNRKLTKVTIGSNVISIGKNAFSGCGKLKTITMGNKVTSIGDNAFYKCTALSKITIPSKVTKIGKQAFYYCKKLNSITIKTVRLTSKNVGSKAFAGTPSNVKIKVPKSKISAYKKLLISKGISKKATIKK